MSNLRRSTTVALALALAFHPGCSLVIDSDRFVGDGDGGMRDDGSVDPNGPSAPAIELTPSAPRTTDALAVAITTPSVDPEGGTVSYEYRWLRDGTVVEQATGERVDASLTAKGETWRVEVTPIGNPGARRGPAAVAEVTIGNTAPVLTTVALDDYLPAVGDSLRATPGAIIDPDRDATSLRLQWYRNDEAIPGATSNVLATAGMAAGDRIRLDAFATDGADSSATVVVGAITLSPASTRWRPLMPSAFTDIASRVFYDEQHRRWVHLDGGFLWETTVVSGRVRSLPIALAGAGPDSERVVVHHDVLGRRLLVRTTENPVLVYALDLTARGGESWSSFTPGGVTPDVRVAAAEYYDRATRTLWLYGGFNDRVAIRITDELWSLSLTPGTESWTLHPTVGDTLPVSFGATMARDPADANVLYVFGGADLGGSGVTDAIQRLRVGGATVEVETLAVGLPRGTFGGSALAVGDAIVIAGGQLEFGSPEMTFGVVRFTPGTSAVVDGSMLPSGAFGLLVQDPDDERRLLQWRGIVDTDSVPELGLGFELRAIDPETLAVTEVAIQVRPPALADAGSIHRGTELLLLGGRLEGGTANPTVFVYRTTSGEWSTLATSPDAVTEQQPEARWGMRFFDASPWVSPQYFAGALAEGSFADRETWELEGNRWLHRTLNAGEVAPEARIGAAFGPGGGCGYDKSYVFGGQRADGTLLAGAHTLECPHDEPRACYWTIAAQGGTTPTGRTYATMGIDRTNHAWVVGGRAAGGPSNEVFSFDGCYGGPAPWNRVVPTGTAPTARYAHSMNLVQGRDGALDAYIVFGGATSEETGGARDDVARLEITSPTTARWVEIPIAAPLRPPPRAYHQAIWDENRSRLIVYGGRASYQNLSDAWELIVVP